MQKKTYVTLISEQAAPNLQCIKEFRDEIDSFLLISTNRMENENRSQFIMNACDLSSKSCLVLIVNEESFSSILADIKGGLQNDMFKNTQGFIVNCTLGTKIMSIALFEYFKDISNAILLYTPIGTNKYRNILEYV